MFSFIKHRINQWREGSLTLGRRYKPLRKDDKKTIARLKDAWKSPSIAAKQRQLIDREMQSMRSGQVAAVFQFLADAVKETGCEHGHIVEVGCASGYYSEILTYLLGHPIHYHGIDYSAALIEDAQRHYPGTSFSIGDATALDLADSSVDVLISGCVLLHVPDYKTAIAESARVAREWVIVHRTPVTYGDETKVFQKKAYGVTCVEYIFSESELLREFRQNGLSVVNTFAIEQAPNEETQQQALKTYVCRKIGGPRETAHVDKE